MSVTTPLAPTRRVAPAKARILETAMTRFYQDGIRSVGVDRLIEESSVTKATFYKHYGSKDRLIRDYVDALATRALDDFDTRAGAAVTPEQLLREWTDHLVDYVHGENFRGDPFLNAAAEFADPAHPVRERITEHFELVTERFASVLEQLGHPLPGAAADRLLLATLGLEAWSYTGDVIAASAAFRSAVEGLIAEAATAAP
ncbi:MAG: TetR/AcrR family transcriptional regulator [Microcella sp.]|uniref:TetR/AcrR family transcriptional regulator n=1 Tax=Microcella sp. TaxID=1913979 RepID=UPI0033156B87